MTPAAGHELRRSIAVLASGRADLWPLTGLINYLALSGHADVILLACGRATAMAYASAPCPAAEVVLIDVDLAADDRPHELVAATAEISREVSKAFAAKASDLLVVLGDRFELLGVMTAATLHRVPVAHLSGGELTYGAIDDSVRHAVTKLSHLHLTATDRYAARVVSLGEEPWRVHATGDPALDRLVDEARATSSKHGRVSVDGVELLPPLGLVTYHPPTLRPNVAQQELEALIAGCSPLRSIVVTAPGADLGAAAVLERVRRWAAEDPRVLFVPSLGASYASLLSRVDVVVGNSSSGIVEAPTFGVPVVNIGERQQGRVRWPGILDVEGDAVSVENAVRKALSPAFRRAVAAIPNPYGDGRAVPRIAEILLTEPLDRLLAKRFHEQ